jgi:hypothetical protein
VFINSGFALHNIPANRIKLSPGKKKPTNKPVSAKITNNKSHKPPYSIMLLGSVNCFKNSHINYYLGKFNDVK